MKLWKLMLLPQLVMPPYWSKRGETSTVTSTRWVLVTPRGKHESTDPPWHMDACVWSKIDAMPTIPSAWQLSKRSSKRGVDRESWVSGCRDSDESLGKLCGGWCEGEDVSLLGVVKHKCPLKQRAVTGRSLSTETWETRRSCFEAEAQILTTDPELRR